MEQCESLFPTSVYSSVARTNHVTLLMDTPRFPCDQEEHCHLENVVSSLHPTLSVLEKQGTQGSHPELVPNLDRGPGTAGNKERSQG